MDRFTFKGPVWEENGGPPKSIIEEIDPVYRKVDPEKRPDEKDDADKTWGKKQWEHVVR